MSVRSAPLICSGHSRPVPDLHYSPVTEDGFFIISACLGMMYTHVVFYLIAIRLSFRFSIPHFPHPVFYTVTALWVNI